MGAINATNGLYDLTNFSTSSNIFDFVKGVNDLSSNMFGIGIILAGFVIMFISFKDYGNREALVASSFISSVLAIMMTAINLCPLTLTIIMVVIFGISISSMFMKQS